jgi:hypothetical protein
MVGGVHLGDKPGMMGRSFCGLVRVCVHPMSILKDALQIGMHEKYGFSLPRANQFCPCGIHKLFTTQDVVF